MKKIISWFIYQFGRFSFHIRRHYYFSCPGNYDWGLVRYCFDLQREKELRDKQFDIKSK